MGQLLLVLEPESAVVAASVSGPPTFRDQLRVGVKLMTVDLGGGTCDITVNAVSSTKPLKLQQLLPASGGSWGGTAVDAMFLALIRDILGTSNYDYLGPSARNELLANWEDVKKRWTNDGGVSIPTSAIVNGLADEIDDSVGLLRRGADNYNVTHGLSGDSALVVNRPGTSIRLPQDVERGLFGGCTIVHACEYVHTLHYSWL